MRDSYLTSLAGSMRRRGSSPPAILAALRAENEARCRPPLDDQQIERIAKSVSRYAPDAGGCEPAAFVNALPDLLNRASLMAEPRWLVADLVPGDGSVLIHAQPREYKTLTVQALLLAVTTGTPAFGLERLEVSEPAPVWYITEEDGWWRVTTRFAALLRGYGLEHPPELLHVSAGKGLNLDSPEWQERLISTAREQGYRLVVLDPLRSLTDTADQGPRELKPFALFLRRFIRETGAVVLIVHHDTKPPATAQDQRRRPQRASGGGIFSIADSPIHVDRVDEHRRMLVPCAFKFAQDPPSVTVRLEQGPGWLRLVGEETTATQPDDAALDHRIIAFLKNAPYTYGNKVAAGVKARKDLVLERLRVLATRGLVDSMDESRGTKWFTRRPS
jgi:AAA domain/Primase C terminal 1 (PriCT-1)